MRVFEDAEVAASGMPAAELVAQDLKATLEGLAAHLFGKDIEVGPAISKIELERALVSVAHPGMVVSGMLWIHSV